MALHKRCRVVRGWRKTYDGIWPMYLRPLPSGGQIIVTQYGRHDWRWSIFPYRDGLHKSATGTATNGDTAKRDALAAADAGYARRPMTSITSTASGTRNTL